MRWVRSNVRTGAWCALVALAIQFALLFGHVHPAAVRSAAGFSPLSIAGTDVPGTPGAPEGPAKPAGLPFDYCAICAVMNLAATGVPPSKPASPVALLADTALYWPLVHVRAAVLPHFLFQSRAPPFA